VAAHAFGRGAVTQDPFNLERFITAQNAAGTYDRALNELRRGRKTSHWMWFVFPQMAGLGSSEMSRRYAINSLEEATAYLHHPVLGKRLRECAQAVVDANARSAEDIFGGIDTRKLQSSMTLFLRADPQQEVFQQVLDKYFQGKRDPLSDSAQL
jgi:uncharacterized protein (DUF1810 family)